MRLFATLIFLTPFIHGAGQSGIVKKISLQEAVSVAMLNNPSLKTAGQKVLVADVEEAYFDFVFRISSYRVLQKQNQLYHDVERVANLRYRAGDIDLLQKTMMTSKVAEIRNSLEMLNEDLMVSGNKMKFLLSSKENIIPLDTMLQMYAIQKGEDLQADTDSSAKLNFENKKETMESELNKYFKKIQYFHDVALGKAQMLMDINTIRFEQEDIDYTDYTQLVEEAFRIRLDYLDTLNKYNQTAIQLELYAY